MKIRIFLRMLILPFLSFRFLYHTLSKVTANGKRVHPLYFSLDTLRYSLFDII